jgi:hypothetical protein
MDGILMNRLMKEMLMRSRTTAEQKVDPISKFEEAVAGSLE